MSVLDVCKNHGFYSVWGGPSLCSCAAAVSISSAQWQVENSLKSPVHSSRFAHQKSSPLLKPPCGTSDMTSSLYLETAPSANDWSSYSTYGDSDPTSWLQSEPGAGAVPYDGLWPNDPWQDHDLSSYRWSDKTNNFMPYPSYYSPALLYNTSLPVSGLLLSSAMLRSVQAEAHYRTDFDSSSGPAPAQPISSISHISGPTHHMKRDCTRQSLPPSQDHRSCIARASDDFLSQASSLFTGVCYTTKRDCPLDINPSITEKYSRAPSKKRSIDALDGYNVKVQALILEWQTLMNLTI